MKRNAGMLRRAYMLIETAESRSFRKPGCLVVQPKQLKLGRALIPCFRTSKADNIYNDKEKCRRNSYEGCH